jgi:hypothetical protein
MRHFHPATLALLFVLATVLAYLALPIAGTLQAMQVVPTPKGQLGGPEPLPTDSAAPADEITETPDDTWLCDVEPRSVEELIDAANSAPAPEPDSTSWDDPALEAQWAAAEAVVDRLVICANRNDPARLFTLYTKEGMARSLQRQGVTGQAVSFLLRSAEEPLPLTAQAQLVSIDAVMASGEDHLRAEFTLMERNGIGEYRSQSYAADLVNVDGDWLIDDVRLA